MTAIKVGFTAELLWQAGVLPRRNSPQQTVEKKKKIDNVDFYYSIKLASATMEVPCDCKGAVLMLPSLVALYLRGFFWGGGGSVCN